MGEALKGLSIKPKVLARRSNEIWDLFLATEQEAKQFTRSILRTTAVRLQTEYRGTRWKKITAHGVPLDISENRMGGLFASYGPIEDVSSSTSKSVIVTGNLVLQVTIMRQAPGEMY